MSAVDRLRWAIRNSGLSQFAVERAASPPLAPGTLSHILRGRRRLTRAAALLEPVLHVRAAWLLFGEKPAWWLVRADDGRCAVDECRLRPCARSLAPPDEEGAPVRFLDRSEAARVLRALRAESTPFNGFDTVRIVAVTPNVEKGAGR